MKKQILVIDDDFSVCRVVKTYLENAGFSVHIAEEGVKGLQLVKDVRPDLILLDVMMPGMDGYAVGSKLQEKSDFADIPIIFCTALSEERDKAKAFSCGAVDYIVKPFNKDDLLGTINKHLKPIPKRKGISREETPLKKLEASELFYRFQEYLAQADLTLKKVNDWSSLRSSNIYSSPILKDIPSSHIAQYIAKFLELSYIPYLDPEALVLDVLSPHFCRKNHLVLITDKSERKTFILSNPFDWELLKSLRFMEPSKGMGDYEIAITEPENIDMLFQEVSGVGSSLVNIIPTTETEETKGKERSTVVLTNNIIYKAVVQRASDIHIESKEGGISVRFRIDDDLQSAFFLKEATGRRLISRTKLLAAMDIAEKRRPQDGAFGITIGSKTLKLRIVSSPSPFGESLVIRLLEPEAKPRPLETLGMMPEQATTLRELANQSKGFILVVGPTGSGKTTTLYSLIGSLNLKVRSLLSVEDPIEYTILEANQQQVNEKIGLTFEKLLKYAMRQDPDVLFIGEIRDPVSASVSIEAASTGHLTLSTIHAANATASIFRLESLGIPREKMAEAFLAIGAQKLLKLLCPYCKKVQPITQEEVDILSKYTNDIPNEVAHKVGCPKCSYTGFYGREAVYEILKCDSEIRDMIRSGKSIHEIRRFARERDNYLMSEHALEKLRSLKFSVQQVFNSVLVEEEERLEQKEAAAQIPTAGKKVILVVEDDEDTRRVVSKLLENRGYEVKVAEDGADALLQIGKRDFDLIISDIMMPNLDGFKLLEIKNQKGLKHLLCS